MKEIGEGCSIAITGKRNKIRFISIKIIPRHTLLRTYSMDMDVRDWRNAQ